MLPCNILIKIIMIVVGAYMIIGNIINTQSYFMLNGSLKHDSLNNRTGFAPSDIGGSSAVGYTNM